MFESENHYKTIAESLPQLAWLATKSGKIYWHNKRWHDYTGLEAPVKPEDYKTLALSGPHASAMEIFLRCIEPGVPFEQELRLRGADGIYRWFLIQASPLHDASGNIVRWFGTDTNIDSYKTTINESSEFLNSVLENIPHMVFVKDAKDFRFVHFNRAGEELLGHTRSDLIGKNDFNFFPKEQAEHFVSKDRKVLTSGKLDIIEEIITTKSGTRTIRTKKIPLIGTNGEPEFLLGISEDITDWLQAEHGKQELMTEKIRRKEREASLEKALFLSDVSSVLVSSLDPREILQDLAKKILPILGDWCTITTINEDQSLDRVLWSHVNPDSQELVNQLMPFSPKTLSESPSIMEVSKTGKSVFSFDFTSADIERVSSSPEQVRLLKKIGCSSFIIVPMSCRGKTYGAIAIMKSQGQHDQQDVLLAEEIGRKAGVAIENAFLYQTAQKAIAVRNEFLSIASHELKTPITALKLQVQMTRQNVNAELNIQPETGKLARTLDSANDQINRLTALIEDLLDVSRIESGKISYSLEPLNISSMVDELTDVYLEHLKAAGCELTTKIIPGLQVLGDKGRLEQVILNLLSNAAKYGEGKPVTLTISNVVNHVLIEVRDQGMGIAADKVESIFDRFVRAISSKNISGLGLGLYISREIIKAHNGEISVKSQLGKGTTFVVSLPLLKA